MTETYALLPEAEVADLDAHLAAGGGRGIERALAMDPADVIEEVRHVRLRGRGGAGFPTGAKWASVVAEAAGGPLTLACNGAEGEPGTYKDRPLLARAPHQLLEGVCIALHATGAERAYVATKQRFTHEADRLRTALDEVRAAGWAGADRVELVLGPDEYLFGEETALLEVIEGKLPLPRILPPYQAGLHGIGPTVVNNVETLAHVARILADGGAAFRAVGTQEAPGTMLFTVTGDVARPGCHELPLGTSMRTLVCELAGGQDIQAVISGVSNPVITGDLLDLPMDFDSFAEAGVGLGSGGFMVYGPQRDMVQVTAVLARFLAVESCGQCLACKLGTGELLDALDALVAGRGTSTHIEEIRKRTLSVTDANRCYLPVGAALLIRSALDEFPAAFAARIGSPSPPEVAVRVPKITDLDFDAGVVTFDPDYHRKRADWSYSEEG
jgi:NADH:ubiquinone oxidoreductase subunit F (NADH-binding)